MMNDKIRETLDKLETFNDPVFLFDEAEHKYTYNGTVYTSVTTFIERFHEPFDSDYESKKKAAKLGVSQESLLAEWAEINRRANEIGTATHLWAENYYKKIWSKRFRNR